MWFPSGRYLYKGSISQLMEQMESQQAGIQYFAENITKQQNGLREKLQAMTELQLKNVELEDALSNMTDLADTLKKKNEALLKENEALRHKGQDLVPDMTNIISPEKFERNAHISPENRAQNAFSRCEDAYANAKNLLSSIMADIDIDIEEDRADATN